MTTPTPEDFELPAPAFNLRWDAASAAYKVDKPNIDGGPCYTPAQVRSILLAFSEAQKGVVAWGAARNGETAFVWGKERPDFSPWSDVAHGNWIPLYGATSVKAEGKVDAEPNLFWNDADPEACHLSIAEVIDSEWSNDSIAIGDTITIQPAIRLPNITVRVIGDPNDSEGWEFEAIAATKDSTP